MKILLTGGAGFIGSNLVEKLLENHQIEKVKVLDNLSTGNILNLKEFLGNPKFEFIEGDIRNKEACFSASEGMDAICHQAALGSVPRSINDPQTTHDVNVNGFINILESARLNNIKRIVYASSSSVYGDLTASPKIESRRGSLLSPYAASKMTNELYAEAFSKTYDLQLIGLRYFNVFGPKQNPEGPYAAVVPLFIKAAVQNISPVINGDGTITRDFTPIQNVVQINLKGLLKDMNGNFSHVFNVACGQTTDLNKMWSYIKEITGASVDANYGPNRKGDILNSLADISLAKTVLGYEPDTDLSGTLAKTISDFKSRFLEF
jgi:UDP-N-acetylglucosamine 4-epimerase